MLRFIFNLFWIPAKILLWLALPLFALCILAAAGAGYFLQKAYQDLPDVQAITQYTPKTPMRVYTADGVQIAEYGEEIRRIMPYREIPKTLIDALLAAEDERFFTHFGLDPKGIARAALANIASRGKRQGASTITQQVARNFYLSPEKTLQRKIYEALLAVKIERTLSKEEILEIYMNQIYLGARAYGFKAAAEIYFGKPPEQLTVAEAAMLAGLPKAPSAYNPYNNPSRSRIRQLYVLGRMKDTGKITQAQYDQAAAEALRLRPASLAFNDSNPYNPFAYAAEAARRIALERFPDSAYASGLKVITTIDSQSQIDASAALRKGLADYDQRHGYRGPEGSWDIGKSAPSDAELEAALENYKDSGEYLAAAVISASPKEVVAFARKFGRISVKGQGLRFASQSLLPGSKTKIAPGSVIRVVNDAPAKDPKDYAWRVAQLPEAEGAFLAMDPKTGAVTAMAGGFDFARNQFNHALQAFRQPGSSFKPFIYGSAIEKGLTPDSVVSDSPFVLSREETGSEPWEPHNYDGKYDGPIDLRAAIARSKNMVSARLLQYVHPIFAQDYALRFGFDPSKIPPLYSMALGAVSVSTAQMASAYSVFANDGKRAVPRIVSEIQDASGKTLAKFSSANDGEQAVSPRNAFLMHQLLVEPVRRGTAAKINAFIKRSDMGGKTGTTNDYVDAWFCGYSRKNLVGIAWIGFDAPKSLGKGETGGTSALPVWIDFMSKALKKYPEENYEAPDGLSFSGGQWRYSEFGDKTIHLSAREAPPDQEDSPAAEPQD